MIINLDEFITEHLRSYTRCPLTYVLREREELGVENVNRIRGWTKIKLWEFIYERCQE